MEPTANGCVILVVYMDDMIMIGSDMTSIQDIMIFLQEHLDIWDLGTPKYFLSIEFAYCPGEIVLNQHKYVHDLLQEMGLLGCKPHTSSIKSQLNFWDLTSPLLVDPHPYQRLAGKLIYLTIT